MPLFSVTDRQDVLDYIISFTQQHEHIVALVAVGSGAYGYIDELSDLDMVVAVDSDENLETVMEYVAAQLRKRLNFIYFKQMPQRRLQVYLTESYLEIDIGYGPYTSAAAAQQHWKVVFDKSGTVDHAMRESWEKRETTSGTHELAKVAECSDSAWHYLMHAASAIKRRQYWRATAEFEYARNLLIELLGCRYPLETRRNREVDKLPAAELAVLEETLVSDLTQEALWCSLAVLTNAIYTELERYGERVRITVNRRHVEEYINACRAL